MEKTWAGPARSRRCSCGTRRKTTHVTIRSAPFAARGCLAGQRLPDDGHRGHQDLLGRSCGLYQRGGPGVLQRLLELVDDGWDRAAVQVCAAAAVVDRSSNLCEPPGRPEGGLAHQHGGDPGEFGRVPRLGHSQGQNFQTWLDSLRKGDISGGKPAEQAYQRRVAGFPEFEILIPAGISPSNTLMVDGFRNLDGMAVEAKYVNARSGPAGLERGGRPHRPGRLRLAPPAQPVAHRPGGWPAARGDRRRRHPAPANAPEARSASPATAPAADSPRPPA
ncbi:restriction endonuclease fold toxin-2 domain-containing protein [Streptomyces sp. NPDC053069]|uniref:restriction endonuclease fold toxin-2 domain-containing protein n=1 Tax=Streptomyces sp. NPDC053069 TaxID=3365695 RepID=UPI0037D4A72C